jgi:endoglucanase
MDEPRLVTARFVPAGTAATLTVTKAGGGGGTVTSAPPGIDCGSDCTHEYASGTIVTLTATPDPGSAFAGWSGCVSATNACSLTIDQARTVTANFVPAFTLTVGKAGNAGGRVVSAPPGIDCGSDCTEEYASGTIVTLTATPDPGSAFTSWSEDCSASCMVTMNQDRSVTATFGPGALLSRLWIPRIPTNRASSGSS